MFKNLTIPCKEVNFIQDDFYFTPYIDNCGQNGWIARVNIEAPFRAFVTEIRMGGNSDSYECDFGWIYEVQFPDEIGTILVDAELIWERINKYIDLKRKYFEMI